MSAKELDRLEVIRRVVELFAAPVFAGGRLASSIRLLMVASGLLALAGLGGVVAGDMQLRNVGIVGYLPLFLVAVVLMGVHFHRTGPVAP